MFLPGPVVRDDLGLSLGRHRVQVRVPYSAASSVAVFSAKTKPGRDCIHSRVK
jgi:hypothetical protein